jgi:hypothetical protein
MKRVLFSVIIAGFLSGIIFSKANAQGDVYVSYQAFYDELTPYGQWISDPQYGYAWVPNADEDFRPYLTDGHWIMTDYGNTWVSDYPWGWACFHYGRWTYNDYYGWIWVPGDEWGPGWVAWQWGDGICGWAPLYPDMSWAGTAYPCPDDWWVFMHPRQLYKPRYHTPWRNDFFHSPNHTKTLLGRSHPVATTYKGNNTTYYSGPTADEVQKVTRKPVEVYHIGNTSFHAPERITENLYNTYIPPRIEQHSKEDNRPAPAHVIPAPQPVGQPEGVRANWDQPRPFKQNLQQQDPSWNRASIGNAQPYYNQSPSQDQSQPSRQYNPAHQNNAAPRYSPAPQNNPAPRYNPAPPPRQQPQRTSPPAYHQPSSQPSRAPSAAPMRHR